MKVSFSVYTLKKHLTCDAFLKLNWNEVNGLIEEHHKYTFTTCQMA